MNDVRSSAFLVNLDEAPSNGCLKIAQATEMLKQQLLKQKKVTSSKWKPLGVLRRMNDA